MKVCQDNKRTYYINYFFYIISTNIQTLDVFQTLRLSMAENLVLTNKIWRWFEQVFNFPKLPKLQILESGSHRVRAQYEHAKESE